MAKNSLFVWICLLLFSGMTHEGNKNKTVSIHDEVKRFKQLVIAHIDPAAAPDGEYTGQCPFWKRFMYRVKVTVKSGKMTHIDVLENGTENAYAKKGMGVVGRMLEKQSPKVQAVTGATVTSKALMKCVEKALKKARPVKAD